MATQITATILPGETLSSAVDLTASVVTMIIIPDEWASAPLSFLVSIDGVRFYDLFDGEHEVRKPGSAGTAILIDPAMTAAADYLKIRSGSRAWPVVQQAERIFQLMVSAS
jgi:hypothetical protein